MYSDIPATVRNIASVLQALKSKDLHKYGLHLGAEGLKSNLCPLGNFCMRWILDILPYMPVPSAGSGGVGKAKKLTFYYSHGQFWNKSGFAIFLFWKRKRVRKGYSVYSPILDIHYNFIR